MYCRYHNYPLYFDYIVRFHKTNLTKIIFLRNFHNRQPNTKIQQIQDTEGQLQGHSLRY